MRFKQFSKKKPKFLTIFSKKNCKALRLAGYIKLNWFSAKLSQTDSREIILGGYQVGQPLINFLVYDRRQKKCGKQSTINQRFIDFRQVDDSLNRDGLLFAMKTISECHNKYISHHLLFQMKDGVKQGGGLWAIIITVSSNWVLWSILYTTLPLPYVNVSIMI